MDRPPDIPFNDPRHAVGLGVDALRLAFERIERVAPKAMQKHVAVVDAARTCRAAAERFVKAPRTAIRGARRKGVRAIYRELERASEAANGLGYPPSPIDELYLLAARPVRLAIAAMEGDAWRTASFDDGTNIPDECWRQAAAGAGVDPWVLEQCEVEWRYRDTVDRKHRGKDMRAAFEAAWLAGERNFAERLLKEKR
jgi:hypothetical protein